MRLWRRLCKNDLSPRASIASQLWPECGYMCIFFVLTVAAAALCILLVDSFSQKSICTYSMCIYTHRIVYAQNSIHSMGALVAFLCRHSQTLMFEGAENEGVAYLICNAAMRHWSRGTLSDVSPGLCSSHEHKDTAGWRASCLCSCMTDKWHRAGCVVVHVALLLVKTSSRECTRGAYSQYVVVQLISRFVYVSFGFATFYHPDCNNPFTEQCRNIRNKMLKFWLLVAKVLSGYAEDVLSYYRNCSLYYL